MTRSANMFGLSWEGKPRHGRIFSRPGQDLTPRNNFWQISFDAIASPVDIPSSISRYQKTLQYAATPLDFVFGIGLYLSPSDMALHPGNIQRYNNKIQIAGLDTAIGHNPGINEAERIASKGDKAFQGKIASPAGTIHKGPQPSQNKTKVSAADRHGTSAEKWQSATAHEEEKNGPWGSGWPCCALYIVSLASLKQPREAGPHSNGQCPQIFCEPSRSLSQCTQEP